MKLTLHVSGEPVAQPRPKARAMPLYTNGRPVIKNGKQVWTARVYNPTDADPWKAEIARHAKASLPPAPIVGPITVSAHFFMPRPPSHFTSKGALTRSAPREHRQTPDIDNLLKAVMDALTDVGLWCNDSHVCRLRDVSKRWAQKTPGVVIEIESNEQQPDPTLADAVKE